MVVAIHLEPQLALEAWLSHRGSQEDVASMFHYEASKLSFLFLYASKSWPGLSPLLHHQGRLTSSLAVATCLSWEARANVTSARAAFQGKSQGWRTLQDAQIGLQALTL